MRYRTKLYLILIGVALLSALLGIGLSYYETNKFTFAQFRSKAISIAATTAAFIDGDLLKEINTPADRNTLAYKEVRDELRKARNFNQRPDVFVIFVYTLKPSADGRNMVMAVTAANTPEETIPVGDPYESPRAKDILENRTDYYSPDSFSEDPWGIWLSAFAPVYDSEGEYVATLGVDINADDIRFEMSKLILIGIYSFLAAAAVAIVVGFFLSRFFARSVVTLCDTLHKIGQGDFDLTLDFATRDEFHEVGIAVNKMVKGLKERESLKLNLARYVSSYVLEQALSSELSPHLEGERKKITVLFCDIRQFSKLAESLPPESVVTILNEFFEKMIETIFEHGGTLDKFLGDGMMVEFGAPLDDPDQEQNAVIAAVQMQKQIRILSKKWLSEGKPALKIGIGIHTGPAVVGNVGSEKRMEYTAIGDTVNVAARLEEATKTINADILVSEATYEATKDHFYFENLGTIPLPGKTEKIKVYTIGSPPDTP